LGKARLLMPLNVRRLEKRLGSVEEKVDKLSSDVHELVSVLKEAFNGRGKAGVPEHVQKREPLGVC